jgi:membrane-bound serine protease (ClpP class)
MRNKLIFLLTVCLTLFLALQTNWSQANKTNAAEKTVHYFKLDTEVHFGMSGFVKRTIQKAKSENAAAIIIGIDTFGGRVDSALEIIEHINTAQELPVYAYVEDKAWSAGALLALGCKAIYMKSGSTIGSATPVSAGGGQAKSEALGEKYVSAIRAKFRSVAEKNNYPPNLAAAMVDNDIEVWQVTVDERTVYLTQDEIDLAKKEKKKITIGPKVTAEGKLLNLTAQQSLTYGLSKGMIENKEDLIAAIELSGAVLVTQERNWTELVAGFLTSSMISGLLMMIGLIALYTEISNPGFGWAGILGISALGLLFWGKYIVNLAEMTEFIIFAVGIVLLLLEIFVVPGFGITGIAGIAFMCIGLYLAFVPFVIPKYPWDITLFSHTLVLMLVSILGSITGFFILLHFLPSLPGMNRLVLTREQRREDGFTVATDKTNTLIGSVGKATTGLRPVGKGQFGQQLLDVMAESGFIEKGSAITIIDVKGNRILVRPV